MKIKLWNWAIILTCTMALNACNNDNNDKECDAKTPCTDDTTCIDHQCIHTECNLRKSCIGELICNDDGNCMPQSEVFQCGKHLACKDDTLKCSHTHQCLECTKKSDCSKGECCREAVCIDCEFPFKEVILINPYEYVDWKQIQYVHSFSHAHATTASAELFQKMGFQHFPFSNYYPSRYIYPLPEEFLNSYSFALGAPNAEHHSTTDSGGRFHFNSLGSFYTTGYGSTPRIDTTISPINYIFTDLSVFDSKHRPWESVYRLDVNTESVQNSSEPVATLSVENGLEVYRSSFNVIGNGVVKDRKLTGVRRNSIYLKTLGDALNVRLEFDPATTRITLLRLMQGCNRPWRDALRAALDGDLKNDLGQRLEGLVFPDSGGITINHPYLPLTSVAEILDYDDRVLGIEVWNAHEGFGKGMRGPNMEFYWKWGEMLSSGRNCLGFFVKDHMLYARGRNILLLPPQNNISHAEREHEALRAYRQGRFFGHLGAIAVNDHGKEILPYDDSKFRFTNIVVRKDLDNKALGLEVSVTGADKNLRPNTQIRFITDKGVALIVNDENGYFPFPRDDSERLICRYVRVEAFAYPSTYLNDQPLTTKTISAMNVAEIANIVDVKSSAPTVDMIFSQAILFKQAK